MTTWLGDKLVAEFVTGLPTKSSWRATDTIVHGLIGGFSYWLSCIMCPELLLKMSGVRHKFTQFLHGKLSVNLIFSFTVPFILACTVDLDHIMYDGFQLITGGQRVPWKRGWFHYTLPPLILATIFYHSALLFHSPLSLRMATLTISSVISHQLDVNLKVENHWYSTYLMNIETIL
ncbi:hypothetical protein Pmani_023520 [Petrolisthes manimaculis]|uniref:Transmembrane protein 267 n=1 Tax=Petrolisthes manimaculis TaxID=1843537 RepID=A0AAE1PBS6_9EUCA|nr:hypothetical protein Pmani_023520 [Petrolisthes manimaculis]